MAIRSAICFASVSMDRRCSSISKKRRPVMRCDVSLLLAIGCFDAAPQAALRSGLLRRAAALVVLLEGETFRLLGESEKAPSVAAEVWWEVRSVWASSMLDGTCISGLMWSGDHADAVSGGVGTLLLPLLACCRFLLLAVGDPKPLVRY